MALKEYQRKRDFRRTPEPRGGRRKRAGKGLRFVVHKHDASRLHYDFRLELGGVLKSWAVPKGPSVNPANKRLAVHVEDHPLEYADFEGTIPKDQYGGGTVMLWDRGTWQPPDTAEADYRTGKLSFELAGEKLAGAWTLVRMHGERGDHGKNWLLIKADDEFARKRAGDDPLRKAPDSVATGRALDEIAAAAKDGHSRPRGSARSRSSRKRSRAATGPTKRPGLAAQRGGEEDGASIPLDKLSSIPGIKRGATPKTFHPQLATLTTAAPQDDAWLHEIKFDGYRILAVRRSRRWALITRNGKDWTDRFPAIAAALQHVPLEQGILDGEIVVLKRNGVSDFQALQNAMRRDQRERMYYFVFDLPFCNGYDLRGVRQIDRKAVLQALLSEVGQGGQRVRCSAYARGEGPALLRQACRLALEGLMAKRVDAGYLQKRSRNWLKVRCGNRQEFVIVGFTDPRGSRKGLGALLVGVYEGKTLRYSGKVGTGFAAAILRELRSTLDKLEVARSPVNNVPAADGRNVHWVKPTLVAEVEFTEWTSDGRLRHPVFHGLREDKPAEKIRREQPAARAAAVKASPETVDGKHRSGRRRGPDEAVVAGVALTHADRVLYPEQRLTKLALAEYYEAVADWILPHVVERPLSIVRCPGGRHKKCFYQKHVAEGMGNAVHGITIRGKLEEGEYLYIKDLAGLVSLVQFGVLEIHPWGSCTDRYDTPDRLVFDLDPGPGVAFGDVVEAARLVRERLESYDLRSFVKTTGGKGLHVVVPLLRRNTWDEARRFSKTVARAIAAEAPDRYTANMRKDQRKKKVFIDYLRNARGATSIAPYSTRARESAPVSTPLDWNELSASLAPAGYTMANISHRLSSLRSDPWAGFSQQRQGLTKRMLSER